MKDKLIETRLTRLGPEALWQYGAMQIAASMLAAEWCRVEERTVSVGNGKTGTASRLAKARKNKTLAVPIETIRMISRIAVEAADATMQSLGEQDRKAYDDDNE